MKRCNSNFYGMRLCVSQRESRKRLRVPPFRLFSADSKYLLSPYGPARIDRGFWIAAQAVSKAVEVTRRGRGFDNGGGKVTCDVSPTLTNPNASCQHLFNFLSLALFSMAALRAVISPFPYESRRGRVYLTQRVSPGRAVNLQVRHISCTQAAYPLTLPSIRPTTSVETAGI